MKNFLIFIVIAVLACLAAKVVFHVPFIPAITLLGLVFGLSLLSTKLGRWGFIVWIGFFIIIGGVAYEYGIDKFTQKFPFTAQMMPYGKTAIDTKMAAVANPSGTLASQVLLDMQAGLENTEAKTVRVIFEKQGPEAAADYLRLVKLRGDKVRQAVLAAPPTMQFISLKSGEMKSTMTFEREQILNLKVSGNPVTIAFPNLLTVKLAVGDHPYEVKGGQSIIFQAKDGDTNVMINKI
jgi:hypothetical protein